MSPAPQLKITAQPIEAEAFRQFGEVVRYAARQGRHMIDTVFDIDHAEARPRFWVNSLPSTPKGGIHIDSLEQHPHSAQTFIPLGTTTCIAVVCGSAPDGGPDMAQLHAFLVEPGQGVCYRRGVWHSGFMSIDAPADVAVIQALIGNSEDTRLQEVQAQIKVDETVTGAA